MIQNFTFAILFFEYIISTRSSGHCFFIPEFVAENLKANKNQRKRSLILQYSFAQKTSLILRISTLLKLKIIFSQNTAKRISEFLSLQILQQTCFCFVPEKTFALHHILTPKNYFLESKYLYISVYLS